MSHFQIPLSEAFRGVSSRITVYPHQVDAIRWMVHQETEKPLIDGRRVAGGLLGDGMGLGKTRSFTSLLTVQGAGRTLLIVPKSVIYQWIRELHSQGHRMFFLHPDYACVALVDSSGRAIIQKRKISFKDLPSNFVALTTIGLVKPYPEPDHSLETKTHFLENSPELTPFKTIVWNRVAIDEAHTLRNGFKLACDKTRFPSKKCLKYVRCHRLLMTEGGSRWGLSGTPLQNRLSDLGSLFSWIGLPVTTMTTMEALKVYISSKMFRRSGDNLHPLTKTAIRFPTESYEEHKVKVVYSSRKEKEFYLAAAGEIADRFAAIQEAGYKDMTSESDNVLLLLTMLRALSAHPQMYIDIHNKRYSAEMPDWLGMVTKHKMIEDKLTELYAIKESAIVFVHFYEEARQLAERAIAAGYEVIEFMNGTIDMEERDWIVEHTRQKVEADIPVVILANIIACGEGLNLQHIHNAIIASLDWNPSNEQQAISRIHRIGQIHKVKVWKYIHEPIMEIGVDIDSYMRQKQEEKEVLASIMISETDNAAASWPAMDLPGHPGTPSTIFRAPAPVRYFHVEPPKAKKSTGHKLGGKDPSKPLVRSVRLGLASLLDSDDELAAPPRPPPTLHGSLPNDRKARAALMAAAADKRK